MAEPTRRNTAVVFTAGTTFCFSRVMQLGGGISTTTRPPVVLAVLALSALWWMFSGAKSCQQRAAVFPPHQKGVVVSSDRMCASLTLLLLRHELFRVHIVQFMIILRQVVGVPTFFSFRSNMLPFINMPWTFLPVCLWCVIRITFGAFWTSRLIYFRSCCIAFLVSVIRTAG